MTFISFTDKGNSDTKIYGYLATAIGIISFLPILFKIYKSKNTDNFTYANLALALVSNLLWIVYGKYINAYATLASGVLYMIVYGFILYYKVLY